MFRAHSLAGVVLLAAVTACSPTINVTTPNGTGTGTTGATGTTGSPKPGASPSTTTVGGTVGGTIVAAGNDFATATSVNAGATVNLKTVAGRDSFFTLTAPAGKDGVLKITLSETNPNWNPGVRFYDSSKAEKDTQYGADGTATPTTGLLPVSAGKAYFFSVNTQDASDVTDLGVKVEVIPVNDASEPNDDFASATALVLGTAKDFFIFAGSDSGPATKGEDQDFFKVDFPAGKTKLRVKITNNTSTKTTNGVDGPQNFFYQIFDNNKTELTSGGGANQNANVDNVHDIPAAGTYFLKLTGNGNSTIASKLTVAAE
ncbi:MAG: hypothetical protein JWM80_1319 [Cyanobacteria bacterium RYN_339]|nr:hypothetical protein [Cyanobacteria bacterium RYN_339]